MLEIMLPIFEYGILSLDQTKSFVSIKPKRSISKKNKFANLLQKINEVS